MSRRLTASTAIATSADVFGARLPGVHRCQVEAALQAVAVVSPAAVVVLSVADVVVENHQTP